MSTVTIRLTTRQRQALRALLSITLDTDDQAPAEDHRHLAMILRKLDTAYAHGIDLARNVKQAAAWIDKLAEDVESEAESMSDDVHPLVAAKMRHVHDARKFLERMRLRER